MNSPLEVAQFLQLASDNPVVDVRSPAEFEKGHIPGALSLPVFSNEERAQIGLTYKELGHLRATRLGLELVGPRMAAMIDAIKRDVRPGRVLVHCWRGGMRSESVAWLLNFSGEFKAELLEGGYKAFRTFALTMFQAPGNLLIVGGMTGSGKTHILKSLNSLGQQTIDLEGLASHKGSAFGAIGQPPAPSQQQFENDLAMELRQMGSDRVVWLEDESRHIGRRAIPDAFWSAMRAAPVVVIDRARSIRLERIVDEYGVARPEDLVASIQKIERRLGGARTREACDFVKSGDLEAASNILLSYYDEMYTYGISKRDPATIRTFDVGSMTDAEIAESLVTEFL